MKKNNTLYPFTSFLIIIICISFLTSCYPGTYIPDPYIVDNDRQRENIYYIPAAPNTPLLTEKNDLYFDIMRSSRPRFTGTEIQAAFMAGKHLGLCAGYFEGGNKSYEPDYTKYNRFEAGAGYIKKLQKGWHFETYAGLGSGKINNTHYTGNSTISLTHFFLQPAIAVSNANQTVQLGLSSRFAGVQFNVTDTLFSTDREPFSHGHIKSLYDQPFHVMWEPSLLFRAGWKNFLFNAQFTYSGDMTNPDLYRSKTNFSIGVSLRLNTVSK